MHDVDADTLLHLSDGVAGAGAINGSFHYPGLQYPPKKRLLIVSNPSRKPEFCKGICQTWNGPGMCH